MSKPFKMKYTNGKKADTSAFPFAQASQFDSGKARNTLLNTIGGGSTEEIVGKKIDDEVERMVVSSIDKSKHSDILKEEQN